MSKEVTANVNNVTNTCFWTRAGLSESLKCTFQIRAGHMDFGLSGKNHQIKNTFKKDDQQTKTGV